MVAQKNKDNLRYFQGKLGKFYVQFQHKSASNT